MNRTIFFDTIKPTLFGGKFTQAQVDGLNALIDSFGRNKVTNIHHAANIITQVHHETGGNMLGIKETVLASHKDKNPSDATVKSRLEAAWAKGQLTWVTSPYWRDGWFGRGPIQLTHKSNYEKMAKRLGVDLVKNPGLALDPKIGADIAVVGMMEGMFTGMKLSQYSFPNCLYLEPKKHPRRIVNGQDGTDDKITTNHFKVVRALEAAGWGDKEVKDVETVEIEPSEPQKPTPIPSPEPTPAKSGGFWTWLFDKLFGK